MNELNWAFLVGAGVAGFAAYYAANAPRVMRHAAAMLIRRAAAVEAAEVARKRAGDAAYVLACEYLEIDEVKPCAVGISEAPAGPAAMVGTWERISRWAASRPTQK